MATAVRTDLVYPSRDGKPMADNTLQFRWIVTIEGGLEHVFRDEPNVFVAGDLLWYPAEGFPEINTAADVMVVFGRPKGDRKSYKQWEEGDLPPQVVFEILSHSNDYLEMKEKEDFYESHGVDEFYIFDPYKKKLLGWRRDGDILRRIPKMQGWVSPLLKIRFEIEDDLRLYGPDGQRFLSYADLAEQRQRERQRADAERQRADVERQRAEAERQRADLGDAKYLQLIERLKAKGISPGNGPSS